MKEMWNRLLLSDFFKENKDTISKSTILLIGTGALGSEICIKIAGCKVNNLILIDGDKISIENIPHSSLFIPSQIGQFKVNVLQDFLKNKFPELSISSYTKFVQEINEQIYSNVDMIICAPDNNQTRLWVNYYSVKNRIPTIFVGIGGKNREWCGYIYKYIPTITGCFTCLSSGGKKETADPDDGNTSFDDDSREKCGIPENIPVPILSPTVGIVGSIVSMIAIEGLTCVERTENYFYFDLNGYLFNKYRINPSDDCDICSMREEIPI